MEWSLACPDWEARLREGRSLLPQLPLDLVAAERAVQVFNKLRLADVPDNPALEVAAGEWFRDIVRAQFGSWDERRQVRHISELLCLVPKKNSKTSYGGLLGLTTLLLNRRPRAKLICCGPTQDIADLAFSQISGAIRLDPVLEQKLHIREHLKRVVHRQTGAELEIMTFDPAVLTGQKPVWILLDEIHVLGKMAKAASALRQLRGARMAVPESFIVFITTQSEEQPTGIFKAEVTRARGIRDGRITGSMLPMLFEFPVAMQRDRTVWTDPVNWPMVTPNLGRSVTIDRLMSAYQDAVDTGEEELRAWASQHLNVEIGVALQTDRWAGALHWDAAAEALTLEDLIARCDVVTAGIDGGGLDDLLGLAFVGRERGTRKWLSWCRAWCHRDVLDLRKSEASRLLEFERLGELIIVDDLAQANLQAAGLVALVEEAGVLGQVGLDPYGPVDAMDALAQFGIEGEDKIAGVGQAWKLNGAIKTVEVRLANRTMAVAAQDLMAWCVGNAKAVAKGNAVSIEKYASGTAKVDPLIALFCAAWLMARNPDSRGPSVYRERGLLVT